MKLEAEKELETYLYGLKENDHPFFEPADEHYDHVFRQFSIPPYGIADLLYIHCNYHDGIKLHIVELKKNPLDHAAITQIARYRQGIKHHIELIFPDENKRPEVEVTGSLVGPSLAKDVCYLIDSIAWLDCHSYKLSLDSKIEFKEECVMGDGVYWQRTDASPKSLKPLSKAMMKQYAASKLDFLKWQKKYEAEKQQSNVVEFKK
jgi:hypothetical protein